MKTIFDAIRENSGGFGHGWTSHSEQFEPLVEVDPTGDESAAFVPAKALPGSESKVAELAARVAAGLPLWHPLDRLHYDDGDDRDRGNGIPQRPIVASTGPALPRVQTGMRRGEWNQSRA